MGSCFLTSDLQVVGKERTHKKGTLSTEAVPKTETTCQRKKGDWKEKKGGSWGSEREMVEASRGGGGGGVGRKEPRKGRRRDGLSRQ